MTWGLDGFGLLDWRAVSTVGLVLPLLLGIMLAIAPGAGATSGIEITDISVEGSGLVTEDGDTTILWRGGTVDLHIAISTGTSEGEGHYDICLILGSNGGQERELSCQSRLLAGNQPTSVTFHRTTWPSDWIGRQPLTVEIRADTIAREVIDRSTMDTVILEMAGDFDSDGLENQREFEVGTAYDRADSDADGIPDALELKPYGTDPLAEDSDSDGLVDGAEVNDYQTDPTSVDTDGDGLHDRAELRQAGTDPNRIDTDGDGLDDAAELNAHQTDPTDPDTDTDGLGDMAEIKRYQTDPNAADTDQDGLRDALEVTTFSTNPSAEDSDSDGLGDGEEVHRFHTDPTTADTDMDGLDDGAEVNEHDSDPNAVDTDGDGLQDGPEVHRFGLDPSRADSDGDGVPDGQEVSRPIPDIDPLTLFLGIGILGLAGWWVWRRVDLPRVGRFTTDDDTPVENPTEADPVEPTPLTNEDRVRVLLESAGGRIRQSRIVEETEWSKSTVSRVLSRMEKDGEISKISLGRGNLITLPGDEPPRSKPRSESSDPPEQTSR